MEKKKLTIDELIHKIQNNDDPSAQLEFLKRSEGLLKKVTERNLLKYAKLNKEFDEVYNMAVKELLSAASAYNFSQKHFAAVAHRIVETKVSRELGKDAKFEMRSKLVDTDEMEALSKSETTVEEESLRLGTSKLLDESLQILTDVKKQVIIQSYLFGKSYDEISKELGLTSEEVKDLEKSSLSELKAYFVVQQKDNRMNPERYKLLQDDGELVYSYWKDFDKYNFLYNEIQTMQGNTKLFFEEKFCGDKLKSYSEISAKTNFEATYISNVIKKELLNVNSKFLNPEFAGEEDEGENG